MSENNPTTETTAATETTVADPLKTHEVRELAHRRPLLCCRYDPTGNVIAAGSQDALVVRWDLESDAKTELSAHDSWVKAVAFSRDAATLLSGGCDGRLIWWENSSQATQPVRTVEAHQGWIRALDVSPDGTLIASGGNDNRVKVYRIDSGEQVADLSAHESNVYSLLFHPEGQILLSGDLGGVVHQWDVSSGKLVRSFDAKKLKNYNGGQRVHYGGVRSLTLSADLTRLAAGGLHKATNPLGNVQEPLVLEFNWESGEEQRALEIGETTSLSISRAIYHPAGFLMAATCYRDCLLLFWNDEATTVFHKHKLAGGAVDMDLHPDGLQVAIAHTDSKSFGPQPPSHLRISRLSA